MTPSRQPKGLLEAATAPADAPHLIGKDPRRLTADDMADAGVPIRLAKAAIRAKCLDCCGDNAAEVRKCVSVSCPLWPFRITGSLPGALKKAALGQRQERCKADSSADSRFPPKTITPVTP